ACQCKLSRHASACGSPVVKNPTGRLGDLPQMQPQASARGSQASARGSSLISCHLGGLQKLMIKKTFTTGIVVLALCAGWALSQDKGGKGGAPGKGAPKAPGMALSSPDFQDGGIIPDKYTQADPMPVSPKLEFGNVPPGTVSF